MAGSENFTLLRTYAKSNTNYTKKGDRAQFLKATLANGKVDILEEQSSAMLHSFSATNSFVFVREDQNIIEVGDELEVILLPI